MADSTYHGVHVSFVQRPTTWGNYRVTYTLSKAMNNVGENFFSSPIDPFDIDKDWGRSDDDQRHRLVLNGSVNSSMDPARSGWKRLTHGFQVSSLLQTYSSLPFNITSGVTTVQASLGGRRSWRRWARDQGEDRLHIEAGALMWIGSGPKSR